MAKLVEFFQSATDIFRHERAGRKVFWITFVVLAITGMIVNAIASSMARGYLLTFIFLIPALYVWLAVAAARARDMGRSGWFCLLTCVPVAGLVVVLWLGLANDEPESPAAR